MNSGYRASRKFILTLLFLVCVSLIAGQSALTADPIKTTRVELPGLTGEGNNVTFAFNRYVLCAPYAPSRQPADEDDLTALDNHFLYLIDTKKPNSTPVAVDLKWFDSDETGTNRVFYPTQVLFEPASSIAFIRGSRFVPAEGGGFNQVEVIATMHINLDDDGKPVANEFVIPIDILGVGDNPTCSDAPVEMASGQNGKYLIFTNGADIFTFNTSLGYIYRVEIVHRDIFDLDKNRISHLSVDPETNVLTVGSNRTTGDEENGFSTETELSFYALADDGTVNLFKRTQVGSFPTGEYLTDGSNIALAMNAEKETADFAWFVTNKGTLCQIDLRADDVLVAPKAMATFPELAEETEAGPRMVSYDAARRTIVVVSQGFDIQIRRPSNGKGKIRRPSNGHRTMGAPSLALARLNKKSKVSATAVVKDQFLGAGGLSNAVQSEDGYWLIATYSGELFSVDLSADLSRLSPVSIGEVGPRTERLDFFGSRSSVLALNSFETDEDGLNIVTPGAMVVGRASDFSAQRASFGLSSATVSAAPVEVSATNKRGPSIRRPCNTTKSNK